MKGTRGKIIHIFPAVSRYSYFITTNFTEYASDFSKPGIIGFEHDILTFLQYNYSFVGWISDSASTNTLPRVF